MNTNNPFDPLYEQLANLEALTLAVLQQLQSIPAETTRDNKPLNVSQAAEFLDISEQTVYQNIKKLPHRKRFGRLYFLKCELMDYLETGTQK